MKYMGGCSEVEKRIGRETAPCCGSCHRDHEEGYSELGDIESDSGGAYYVVCCVVRGDVSEDERRKLFAGVGRKARKG